jgi:MFS transporter, UMF1 family
LLLALNVALVARAASLGISTGEAIRLSLGSAGVWWALFGLVPAIRLNLVRQPSQAATEVGWTGLRRMSEGYRALLRYPHTLRFLLAYLLYNDGVQTAIGQAALFGQEEMGIPISTIALVILAGQFIAVGSSIGFNRLARRIGAKSAVLLSLALWTASIVYAYRWLRTTDEYIGLGMVFAIAIGGSQALSRSLFSLLVPRGREANYFGLFMISSRGTSWLGPLCFGLAFQLSHSYRVAIVSVLIFLFSGMLLLMGVDFGKGALEASDSVGGGELRPHEGGNAG